MGGVDAALRVTKHVEFGGGWLDDMTSGSNYRLRSVNSTIRFGLTTSLHLEGADSQGSATNGVLLTTVSAKTAEGAAARLELKQQLQQADRACVRRHGAKRILEPIVRHDARSHRGGCLCSGDDHTERQGHG